MNLIITLTSIIRSNFTLSYLYKNILLNFLLTYSNQTKIIFSKIIFLKVILSKVKPNIPFDGQHKEISHHARLLAQILRDVPQEQKRWSTDSTACWQKGHIASTGCSIPILHNFSLLFSFSCSTNQTRISAWGGTQSKSPCCLHWVSYTLASQRI